MSNSETYKDTGATSVYYQGVYAERERIVELAQSYKNKPDFTIDNLISLILDGERK